MSSAIFFLSLEGNSTCHVECLIPLSKVCTEYATDESIIVQVIDWGMVPYHCKSPSCEIVYLLTIEKLMAKLVSQLIRPYQDTFISYKILSFHP